MIAEPLLAGAIQVIATLLTYIAVVGAIGTLGIAEITAPLPGVDTAELP